ncbi:hypothetical protein BCR44DRAFT_38560 [Catenaria anguillulae PL171]|uniref:Uncharacterized protein n=1 Tax=Catenaria anguillulae PL171 TaxID=765915 RepID=A0A1Y2HP32_9FUNG|nr:hypothetical protein BCR44DRAFT_38560 [Catenaria anguillulae PL171]
MKLWSFSSCLLFVLSFRPAFHSKPGVASMVMPGSGFITQQDFQIPGLDFQVKMNPLNNCPSYCLFAGDCYFPCM